eukprot:4516228-Amphidinium_carterae.1
MEVQAVSPKKTDRAPAAGEVASEVDAAEVALVEHWYERDLPTQSSSFFALLLLRLSHVSRHVYTMHLAAIDTAGFQHGPDLRTSKLYNHTSNPIQQTIIWLSLFCNSTTDEVGVGGGGADSSGGGGKGRFATGALRGASFTAGSNPPASTVHIATATNKTASKRCQLHRHKVLKDVFFKPTLPRSSFHLSVVEAISYQAREAYLRCLLLWWWWTCRWIWRRTGWSMQPWSLNLISSAHHRHSQPRLV